MPKYVNATCAHCNEFRPWCRGVRLRVPHKAKEFAARVSFLCEACRRLLNGRYRLAEVEKGK